MAVYVKYGQSASAMRNSCHNSKLYNIDRWTLYIIAAKYLKSTAIEITIELNEHPHDPVLT